MIKPLIKHTMPVEGIHIGNKPIYFKLLDSNDSNRALELFKEHNIPVGTYKDLLSVFCIEEAAFNIRMFFENEEYEGEEPSNINDVVEEHKLCLANILLQDGNLERVFNDENIRDICFSYIRENILIKSMG